MALPSVLAWHAVSLGCFQPYRCMICFRRFRVFEVGHKLRRLELVMNFPAGGAGANFSQFEERGATNISYLRATSDEEMRKIGPSPPGCDAKRALLRCLPRRWNHHSLRIPPRLGRFAYATPPTRKFITGSRSGGERARKVQIMAFQPW